MITGFTILNLNGHEKEAIQFIRKVCILDDPSIADNIVAVGNGVNVYSKCLTAELLENQPFECSPINTITGKFLVASAVDFPLELKYGNDKVVRLQPTMYLYVEENEIEPFRLYQKQGLVAIIPEPIGDAIANSNWILAYNVWNDEGEWIDNEIWRD